MEAKELNDLVGPLLDRIGWPMYDGMTLGPFGPDEWAYRSQNAISGDRISAKSAASLIRCHIEDWLLKEPGDRVLIENNHPFGMMVGYYDPQYKGESTLHALIAAATAELEKEP